MGTQQMSGKHQTPIQAWKAEVDYALEYARIDEESPVRAAYYWLIQDIDPCDSDLAGKVKAIWNRTLTVDEAVAICRAHGADI